MTDEIAPAARWRGRIERATARVIARQPILAGTVLTVVLLAATTALMHPGYQSGDDPSMALYAAGVAIRQTPDAHLLFMHSWIGWLLSWLYVARPDVPWYAILLYGVLAVAYVALFDALWQRQRTTTAFVFFLVLFVVSLGPYTQELQFTTIAMFCTAAGWLVVAARAMDGDDEEDRGSLLLGLLALLLGASVRSIGFLLASLLCVPLLLYAFTAATRVGRRRLTVLAVAGGLGFAILYGLNSTYYRADPAWADFYEWNALRANFNDFQAIPYDARTRPAFDAAGWSRNDYLMIKNWFHADARTFSKEKMRRIVAAVGAYGTDVASAETVRRLSIAFGSRHWLSTAMIVGWIGIVWGFRRVWPVVATLAVAAGVIVAVAVLLKPVPPRISMVIAGTCALAAAFLAESRRERTPRTHRRILAILMIAALVAHAAYCVRYDIGRAYARDRQRHAFEADLAELAPRPSELYVAWGDAFPFKRIDPLASFGPLREMWILPLGVELQTPHVAGTLERFGIDDLYLAPVVKPNVYLVSDERKNQLYVDYMREKYQLDVALRPRFEGRTFVVYHAHLR